MNTPQRILVTGSAGRLGRAAVSELAARGHIVTGFDIRPTPGLPPQQCVVATLAEGDALWKAAAGVNAILHLAATADDSNFPRRAPPDDGDNFLTELVPNNLIGPYQVMEVARKRAIARVILASTGQVIDGHLRDGRFPVTPDTSPRPRYLYACTKVFLEALGQVYSRQHGIAVLAARLGWCPRDANQVAEIQASQLAQDVYLSPADAGRFFAACVEVAQLPPFAIVYATSRFTHTLRYDLTKTRELLRWEPEEQWPEGI
ncbi:MAG: NAD(P)-dependent oxidoreductase [Planctomycetia bacterium]|nr:NAD(P)-dependent oxidoreductase [Planctomycetia bacterium]